MEFRSVFDGVRNRVSRSFIVVKDDDSSNEDYVFSRTKQQFKDECDINRIVQMYPDINSEEYERKVSGVLAMNPDLYGEYDSSMDYTQAVEIVDRAREQFESLPSVLRERFAHDPFQFLDYVNDSKNLEEATNLGLFKKVLPSTNISSEVPSDTVIQPVKPAETQMSQSSEPMP